MTEDGCQLVRPRGVGGDSGRGRIDTLCDSAFHLAPDVLADEQYGLNKGEAHHALKNALQIGQIRDRTTDRQHWALPAGLCVELLLGRTFDELTHVSHSLAALMCRSRAI